MMTMEMCLHKYYFNYVTDLKRPRDEAIQHTHTDTNCVHWAKSEIDQAAPEERIIYVCQRSLLFWNRYEYNKKKTSINFYWIKLLIIVFSPDDFLGSD
jgi:hypothetical protein